MGVGQQRPAEPSIIRQAVEQWPEGQEVIPFMPQFVSPAFKGLNGVTGVPATDIDSSYKQVPDTLNITAVRTDFLSVPLFFNQVCWTSTEPTLVEKPVPSDPVPWEQHYWHAQVRNTGIIPTSPCWYYYNWIPAFGVLPTWDDYFKASLLVEFTCTPVWYDKSGVYGTTVTMEATSLEMTVLPGSYRWDLQSSTSRTLDTETGLYTYAGVRTWLQGDFVVLEDFTIAPVKVA